MKVRGSRFRSLVRRNVRRHKVDSSQLAAFASGLRKRQMALVYGIEGAAKKADVHMVSELREFGWAVSAASKICRQCIPALPVKYQAPNKHDHLRTIPRAAFE